MVAVAGGFSGDDDGGARLRAQAFARAARQSRQARRLRWLLPAIGVLLTLVIVGATTVTRIAIGLSIGDLHIDSSGLTMDAPHLSGSDGKGRTYNVTAENAIQSLTDTRIIRLTKIVANVKQADDSFADFSADSGIYDAGAQKLTLLDNIKIIGSDSSTADLKQAVIDLSTGAVTSDGPVAFSSTLGEIKAKDMGVTRKAGSITFGGGVHMTIDPKGMQAPNPLKDSLDKAGSKP